jgi:Pentapeptide repeats (8 copies)
MPLFKLTNRWTSEPIAVFKAKSFQQAIQLASNHRVSLAAADLCESDLAASFIGYADLRGANLRNINLSGSFVSYADLSRSNLCGARLDHCILESVDLRGADLRGASLIEANLCNATLTGADLRCCNLHGARLQGTIYDWQWGVMASELLRRDREYSNVGIQLVLDIDCIEYSGSFDWVRLLFDHRAATAWAAQVLSRVLTPHDNAPDALRYIAANALRDY